MIQLLDTNTQMNHDKVVALTTFLNSVLQVLHNGPFLPFGATYQLFLNGVKVDSGYPVDDAYALSEDQLPSPSLQNEVNL